MAIHNSTILQQHGYLYSGCIFVSDRWQVQIQYYGMNSIKKQIIRHNKDSSMYFFKFKLFPIWRSVILNFLFNF